MGAIKLITTGNPAWFVDKEADISVGATTEWQFWMAGCDENITWSPPTLSHSQGLNEVIVSHDLIKVSHTLIYEGVWVYV